MTGIRLSLTVGTVLALAGTAAANERVDSNGNRMVPELGVTHAEEDISRILFVNRCPGNCIVQPGPNSARANTSAIIGDTIQLSEYRWGEDSWNTMMECVREIYRPYNIEVTDVDPGGSVPHHEAIAAGTDEEAGMSGVGGVSPFNCGPTNNNISFTFANQAGNNPIYYCSVVAQESAHSFGLEHSLNCADPMTYLPACGRQFFRTGIVPCGEGPGPRDCECGGTGQDVHGWLLGVLGVNPAGLPGPDLNIVVPQDGATVADGFTTNSQASDIRGIDRVEFWVNGTKLGEREGGSSTYAFTAPASLADGILDIEVKAYNDINAETVQKITVTKGAPCQNASSCNEGQLCEEGRCITPPPTAALGEQCQDARECISGVCAQVGDDKLCSEDCYPQDPRCASGFECLAIDFDNGVCWPADGGGDDCGCEVGASDNEERNRGILPLLGLLMLGLIWRGGRRR